MKSCTQCHETKPLGDFYREKRMSDGRSSWCKECRKARGRERYAVTREERIAYRRRYVAEHREEARKSDRASRAKNKDKRHVTQQTWNKRNSEKLKAYFQAYDAARKGRKKPPTSPATQRAYYQSHRDKLRANAKTYRQAHPEQERIWKHNRRARKATVVCDLTVEQFAAICAAQHGLCACCGKKRKLTIDHVIPIIKGGAHTANNIQGLCRSCNSSKRAKDTDYRKALLLPLWQEGKLIP